MQGFYVDRNLTLTKELTNDEIHDQMKTMFKSKEEYDAMNDSLREELFGDEKEVEEDDKS